MHLQEAPAAGKYVLNIAEWSRLHKGVPKRVRKYYVIRWTLDEVLAACGGRNRGWWKSAKKRKLIDVGDVHSVCRFILSQWSRREERRLRREKRRKVRGGG